MNEIVLKTFIILGCRSSDLPPAEHLLRPGAAPPPDVAPDGHQPHRLGQNAHRPLLPRVPRGAGDQQRDGRSCRTVPRRHLRDHSSIT